MIKLIRLGFWNRLAVVVAGLALVVLPLWGLGDAENTHTKTAQFGYELCNRRWESRWGDPQYAAGMRACLDDEMTAIQSFQRGPIYREALFYTAVLCVIVYGLLWLLVWIAKWVWRGRTQKK